jgi:hypothetical protein
VAGVGACQTGHDKLLADPGRALTSRAHRADAARGVVDRDLNCVVAERAVANRKHAQGRGRQIQRGLARHPGVAVRGQINNSPNAFLGELRSAQRAFGPEVGSGFGQEHRGAPGHAYRVQDQETGPAAGGRADHADHKLVRARPLAAVHGRVHLFQTVCFKGLFPGGHFLINRDTLTHRCHERPAQGAYPAQGIETRSGAGMVSASRDQRQIPARGGFREVRRGIVIELRTKALERSVGQVEIVTHGHPPRKNGRVGGHAPEVLVPAGNGTGPVD